MISYGNFYLLMPLIFILSIIQPTYAVENIKTTELVVKSTTADLFFLCRRNNSVRWLRIYKLENGKCNTEYSKEGYLQVVGSATYYSSCEGILHSVKKNLEEGGFICSLVLKHSVIEF